MEKGEERAEDLVARVIQEIIQRVPELVVGILREPTILQDFRRLGQGERRDKGIGRTSNKSHGAGGEI